ncbi:MAG TPA: siderophore-interacting protein [Corynebacterium kroppenstedtii]|nr:siderophore-interacting protein [Corynebacterium kroppenstedtii]
MPIVPTSAAPCSQIHTHPAREHTFITTACVERSIRLAPNLQRITLSSSQFRDLKLTGPDEFFGLFMPKPGTRYQPLPPFEGGNIRAHAKHIPSNKRPDLRWYTVRHFDGESGTVDFDIATHGAHLEGEHANHIGPGLRWALSVSPGDSVGFYTAHGLWQNYHSRQLLVADASSTPSILSIVEFQGLYSTDLACECHLVVVVESPGDLEPRFEAICAQVNGSVHVINAPIPQQAQAVTEFLHNAHTEGHPLTQVDYVWACGEQSLARQVRHEAVKKWGLPSKDVFWSPYWILGRPRP